MKRLWWFLWYLMIQKDKVYLDCLLFILSDMYLICIHIWFVSDLIHLYLSIIKFISFFYISPNTLIQTDIKLIPNYNARPPNGTKRLPRATLKWYTYVCIHLRDTTRSWSRLIIYPGIPLRRWYWVDYDVRQQCRQNIL